MSDGLDAAIAALEPHRLSPRELAELLWLGARMSPPARVEPSAAPVPEAAFEPAPFAVSSGEAPAPAQDSLERDVIDEPPGAGPPVEVMFAPAAAEAPTRASREVIAESAPAAPPMAERPRGSRRQARVATAAAGDDRALRRALHQFARHRPVGAWQIDVAVTVQQTAAARVLLPRVRRAQRRATWCVLLFDSAGQMEPWRTDFARIERAAREVASFDGVSSFSVDLEDPRRVVARADGRVVDLAQALRPGDEHVILLVSDGLGAGVGALGAALASFPRGSKVAWLHPWPQRSWPRSGVAELAPAVPAGLWDEGFGSIRAPLVPMTAGGLGSLVPWIRGGGGRGLRAVEIPAEAAEAWEPDADDSAELTAAEVRHAVRSLGSEARQIAALAAAVPGLVDLRVLTAMASRFLSTKDSRFGVAEAMASGLFERDPGAARDEPVRLRFASETAREVALEYLDVSLLAEVHALLIKLLSGDGDGADALGIPIDLLIAAAEGRPLPRFSEDLPDGVKWLLRLHDAESVQVEARNEPVAEAPRDPPPAPPEVASFEERLRALEDAPDEATARALQREVEATLDDEGGAVAGADESWRVDLVRLALVFEMLGLDSDALALLKRSVWWDGASEGLGLRALADHYERREMWDDAETALAGLTRRDPWDRQELCLRHADLAFVERGDLVRSGIIYTDLLNQPELDAKVRYAAEHGRYSVYQRASDHQRALMDNLWEGRRESPMQGRDAFERHGPRRRAASPTQWPNPPASQSRFHPRRRLLTLLLAGVFDASESTGRRWMKRVEDLAKEFHATAELAATAWRVMHPRLGPERCAILLRWTTLGGAPDARRAIALRCAIALSPNDSSLRVEVESVRAQSVPSLSGSALARVVGKMMAEFPPEHARALRRQWMNELCVSAWLTMDELDRARLDRAWRAWQAGNDRGFVLGLVELQGRARGTRELLDSIECAFSEASSSERVSKWNFVS